MNPFANRVSEPRRPFDNPSPKSSEKPNNPELDQASDVSFSVAAESNSESSGQQPIPPPSSPRQYRAIGLVRGKYQPQEQLTRGLLMSAETAIEAVLLGRIISLIKNHLDLDKEHLWVVYPRTRQEDNNLHVQIVGVWEPETLALNSVSQPDSEPQSGYFSIRGEVIFSSQEQEKIIVKIRQSPKRESEKPKFFKLQLQGILPGKSVGNFWDLHVQLQGQTLVVTDATNIGSIPRKKPLPRRKKPSEKPGKPSQRSVASKPKIRPQKSAYPSQDSSERKLERPQRPSRIKTKQTEDTHKED